MQWGETRSDQTRPDQTHTHQPQERDCSTDQNAPGPFYLCASPQLSMQSRTQCRFYHEIEKGKFTFLGFFLCQNQSEALCFESLKPTLRGWREKGAPTRTYPDQREQSWASIYTCLPPESQSNGSGGHFTQEKQIMEKNNINKKKGKCPNPLLSFTTVVSQTFFIIIRCIVYIISIKSMLVFFFLNCLLSFLYKKKKKAKLKYFSRKYGLKHGKQDNSQTT